MAVGDTMRAAKGGRGPAGLIAAFVLLALEGCAGAYPVAGYPVAPAPLDERVPAPPRSSVPLSWRPGYYDYRGGRYVWTPGRWVSAQGHGTMWQDGYWTRSGPDTYAWVPARWR